MSIQHQTSVHGDGSRLTRRAVNGVDVGREIAGVDDRVHTGDTDSARALHAPEGMGAAHNRGGDEGLENSHGESKLKG